MRHVHLSAQYLHEAKLTKQQKVMTHHADVQII